MDQLGLLPSLLLASLCGICFGAAAPPRVLPWLNWLAFAPLLLVLRRPELSLRRAFLLGWVGGLGVGLLGFPWIAELLERFAGLPAPLAAAAMVVHSAWLALPYGVWALLLQWGPERGWQSWLWPLVTFPLVTGLWPVVFPYTPLIGLAQSPAWIQLAELGGVPLVEAQVLLVGLCLVHALREPRLPRAALGAALALAVPLASWGAGQLRMVQIDAEAGAARSVRFGLVQPNTPPLLGDPATSMERLREPSRDAERRGAQIMVWPEATYPFHLLSTLSVDPEHPDGRVLALHATPTLFGASSSPLEADRVYNSLFHLDAEGRVQGRFDKVMLVPFGETIPLADAEWLRSMVPQIGQLSRGAGPARFEVLPVRSLPELAAAAGADPAADPPAAAEEPPPERVAVGPMICFEDILPSFARATAAQPGGIEVFVNATIDAWYGVEQEPFEHLALAQFRSVEHRVPLVRSVSTGVSAVIDAAGRVAASLPPRDVREATLDEHPPEALVATVALARNTEFAPTPFAQLGWRLPQLCGLLALGQAAAQLRERRRRSASSAAQREWAA